MGKQEQNKQTEKTKQQNTQTNKKERNTVLGL